jgi:hypothetical protein
LIMFEHGGWGWEFSPNFIQLVYCRCHSNYKVLTFGLFSTDHEAFPEQTWQIPHLITRQPNLPPRDQHSEKSDIAPSNAIMSFHAEVQLCMSSLPGGELGVCSRKRIPKDTVIGPYKGRRVKLEEVKQKRGVDMPYLWEVCICFSFGISEDIDNWKVSFKLVQLFQVCWLNNVQLSWVEANPIQHQPTLCWKKAAFSKDVSGHLPHTFVPKGKSLGLIRPANRVSVSVDFTARAKE